MYRFWSWSFFEKFNFDNLKSTFEAGIYWCCVSECRGESYSSLILLWRDTSDWVGSFTESTLTLTSFYIDPLIPTPRASIRNHWTITMRNISTLTSTYIQKAGVLSCWASGVRTRQIVLYFPQTSGLKTVKTSFWVKKLNKICFCCFFLSSVINTGNLSMSI